MATSTPTFTPETARQFDRFSVANAVTVKQALPCGCEPYVDVFTCKRWKAQGFQVQRGEGNRDHKRVPTTSDNAPSVNSWGETSERGESSLRVAGKTKGARGSGRSSPVGARTGRLRGRCLVAGGVRRDVFTRRRLARRWATAPRSRARDRSARAEELA
jgi:hypothetical protein